MTGNHVGCAGAGVNVTDLERGRREVIITFVPLQGAKRIQCRRQQMDGIARQVWIGHMALLTVYHQATIE